MKVYRISGLGADDRAFYKMVLPVGYEPVPLPWIPALPGESLHDYSLRMANGIDAREPFVLLGLSLGGMVAAEIAWQLKPRLTILISSISNSDQLPPGYRWAGRLGLHRVLPIGWIKSAVVVKRFFMSETETDRQMIRDMVHAADPAFIRWALGAVLHWNRQGTLTGLVHLQGSKDELFPLRWVQPTHVVEGGRHLMILNNAGEINSILRTVLPLHGSPIR